MNQQTIKQEVRKTISAMDAKQFYKFIEELFNIYNKTHIDPLYFHRFNSESDSF